MDKNLIFYDIMWYNYPEDKQYFSITKELIEWVNTPKNTEKKLSENTTEQEKILNKYKFLYKQIPFVDSIYVCNSVSFKSVNENSDIDLFIVCKNNRIFLAKFFIWLFFKLFWIYGTHEKNKFCIWFYITKDYQDLYPISINPIDLYLAYWIAHLQWLYSENWEFNIYKENIWVKSIIPNFALKEKKILNIEKTSWKWIIKKILETLFWWDFLNKIIWFFWKKRMIKWKNKLWSKWKSIIISDNILKFQAPDIRKRVYLQYKVLKNNFEEKTRKIEEERLF